MEALKVVLIPELERRGFVNIPLSKELAKDRDWRLTRPYGRFRRIAEDGFQTMSMELNKYGGHKFRLSLGTVPKEGVKIAFGKIISQEDVWADHLSIHYCLFKSKRRWSYFSVWRWPWQKTDKSHYFKLVEDVVKLLPEVEDVFSSGRCGPHIYRFDNKYGEANMRQMEKVKREKEQSNN